MELLMTKEGQVLQVRIGSMGCFAFHTGLFVHPKQSNLV